MTPSRPPALWSDRLWPVLAGVLTAGGVIGTAHAYGLLGLVLLPATLWLLVSLMVWGAFSDNGVTSFRALRYGGLAAHSFVTAIGVLILFPLLGWALLAVWALTSPAVSGRLARRRDRRRGRASVDVPRAAPRRDQARVDRAFSEIVRDFDGTA